MTKVVMIPKVYQPPIQITYEENKINSCKECFYLLRYPDGFLFWKEKYFCSVCSLKNEDAKRLKIKNKTPKSLDKDATRVYIENSDQIPNWCPLQDAK